MGVTSIIITGVIFGVFKLGKFSKPNLNLSDSSSVDNSLADKGSTNPSSGENASSNNNLLGVLGSGKGPSTVKVLGTGEGPSSEQVMNSLADMVDIPLVDTPLVDIPFGLNYLYFGLRYLYLKNKKNDNEGDK